MRPETHNWGHGERLTAKGQWDMKQALDYHSKLKICGNCGKTYPKEKDKCPRCGSEKLFGGKEVRHEKRQSLSG